MNNKETHDKLGDAMTKPGLYLLDANTAELSEWTPEGLNPIPLSEELKAQIVFGTRKKENPDENTPQ